MKASFFTVSDPATQNNDSVCLSATPDYEVKVSSEGNLNNASGGIVLGNNTKFMCTYGMEFYILVYI